MKLHPVRVFFSHLNSLRFLSTKSKVKCYDVVIVGGGLMGLSAAYFLATRINPSTICVIERDTQFTQNSTVRSWGSIRHQFSIAENIRMSQFGFDFLQNLDNYLGLGGDSLDVQFKHGTYCFLASEKGISILEQNAKIQKSENVGISLLSTDQVSQKYPWLNSEGIAMATHVNEGEGWFDPWLLLSHFKTKISNMGVELIKGNVCHIGMNNGKISQLQLITSSKQTETLECDHFVNAAGAWAAPLAALVHVDLPVKAVKRISYVVNCPEGFTDPVLLFDTVQNIYLRPESAKQYIIAEHPDEEEHSDNLDFEIDQQYFETSIWPKLAYRIPAFEKLKVTSAWAGFYDYNILDQNGIISVHPEIDNLYFCNGFSGHGLQQSPAAGRAISELIIDGIFTTLDLSSFSFERFSQNNLIIENNII